MSGWIGVDLDCTLAHYDGFKGAAHIGEPIMRTIRRIKYFLRKGRKVKIFTARVFVPKASVEDANFQIAAIESEQARKAIARFCKEHVGQELEVTNEKDYGMVTLYDDRAEQVIPNTGKLVRHELRMAVEALQKIANGCGAQAYLVARDALS